MAQERSDRCDNLSARLLGGPLERRRWVKRFVYPHLPAKFLLRFLWMYFLKLGFLDGVTGWRFCLFISSYELQIEQKLVESRLGNEGQSRVMHHSRSE